MPRSPSPLVVWPIKPQRLSELLEPVESDLLRVVWTTWLKQASAAPVRATWTPNTKSRIGGSFGDPGATVWIEPVDRADQGRIRDALEAQVVADLLAWMKAAFAAGDAWKLTHHERAWFYVSGGFAAQDRDGFHYDQMEPHKP